jgi:hypothetical protein
MFMVGSGGGVDGLVATSSQAASVTSGGESGAQHWLLSFVQAPSGDGRLWRNLAHNARPFATAFTKAWVVQA